MSNKLMKTLTFPDGSLYEIADQEARTKIEELLNNKENLSNKINAIAEDNKNDTSHYPSVKAVYDFVGNITNEMESILDELIALTEQRGV